jgi:hypothetical protein
MKSASAARTAAMLGDQKKNPEVAGKVKSIREYHS